MNRFRDKIMKNFSFFFMSHLKQNCFYFEVSQTPASVINGKKNEIDFIVIEN